MSTLTQEDRDQIQTIVEETWVKASLSSDWDTVTALCTEDIDYMPADIPWLHGRNELKGFLEDFPQLVEFSQTLVNATGDSSLCALHGTMAISFVVDGQKLTGLAKCSRPPPSRTGNGCSRRFASTGMLHRRSRPPRPRVGGPKMKVMRLSPLLLLAMVACAINEGVGEADRWKPFPGALADTESRDLTSEVTGRTYRISVALPQDYATSKKTYPVLYAVDANTQFGTVVEAARLLHLEEAVPELIIVGIGYPVGWLTNGDGWRLVDLTPTVDSSKGGGGEAPGFLEFMRRELIPLVEAEFRARPKGRALYGHSLGGLYALYALFAGEGTFERYIAGSPSFGWDDRVIFRQEAVYAESHDFLSARLFLSSGSLEDSEEWGESVAEVEKFVTKLATRSYRELRVATAYFSDETHMSVIPATVSRGLRAVYEGFVLSEHD